MTRYFVGGGAGFIGSHLVHRLLARPDAEVVVFDNLVSGREWHLDDVRADPRLRITVADLKDPEALAAELAGADHVFHFAANADIAKAATDPGVDFWDGTYLTHCLLEAMRVTGVKRLTYASGSGVYGDRGEEVVGESFGPLLPVS